MSGNVRLHVRLHVHVRFYGPVVRRCPVRSIATPIHFHLNIHMRALGADHLCILGIEGEGHGVVGEEISLDVAEFV